MTPVFYADVGHSSSGVTGLAPYIVLGYGAKQSPP
jgi:hypothetical protein